MGAKIEDAIAELIIQKPFYGYLLAWFKKVEDKNLPAPMATALNKTGTPILYYDETKMKTITDECRAEIKNFKDGKPPEGWEPEYREWTHGETCAVLEHECLHQINLHPIRRQGRDAMLQSKFGLVSAWNIATDMAINQMTKELPQDCVDYRDFGFKANESSETYYNLLMEKGEVENCPGCGTDFGKLDEPQGQQGQDGDGQDQQGQGDDQSQQGGGQGQDQNQQGQGQGQGQQQGGGGSGGNQMECPCCGSSGVIDDHGKWDDAHAPSPELYREKIRRMVGEAYRKAGEERGTQGYLPAGAQRMIDEALKESYDWRPLFRQFCNGVRSHERRSTRFKPNRRLSGWARARGLPQTYQYAFPGARNKYQGCIGVLVDTSGSISAEDIAQFNSELKAMAEGLEVIVIECDAEIHDIYQYNRRLPQEFKGGGGTVFNPVFDAIRGDYQGGYERPEDIRLLRNIEALVVLTDGYATVPRKDEVKVPVLWALLPGGRRPTDEYGIEIQLGKAGEDEFGGY